VCCVNNSSPMVQFKATMNYFATVSFCYNIITYMAYTDTVIHLFYSLFDLVISYTRYYYNVTFMLISWFCAYHCFCNESQGDVYYYKRFSRTRNKYILLFYFYLFNFVKFFYIGEYKKYACFQTRKIEIKASLEAKIRN